ncbi:MAG: DUF2220 family protein [Bacteroidota bacterium]|nr:DUF2220 family protein [Bacteroidota bacterium]
MITPNEIKKIALKKWDDYLRSLITKEDFFPLEINRIGKIKPNEAFWDYENTVKSINDLIANSNLKMPKSYHIEFIEINNRKVKSARFPDSIKFLTEEDYLHFISKELESKSFVETSAKIINAISQLREWILQNPNSVIENAKTWDDLINVCNYFLKTPKPYLYIRELPIEVHTKFVESNKGIITSLLNFLISEFVNKEEKTFETRFNLKLPESLIRFKLLDTNLSGNYFSGVDDISIPVSQFENIKLPISRVIIVENKTTLNTFLTLPPLNATMAIYGGGRAVSFLKNVKWLDEVKILYWGDIDAHGLAILNQFKEYFPNTQSILMDKITLDNFKEFQVMGTNMEDTLLKHLNSDELEFYRYLRINRIRLEQEKVSNDYVLKFLKSISF